MVKGVGGVCDATLWILIVMLDTQLYAFVETQNSMAKGWTLPMWNTSQHT